MLNIFTVEENIIKIYAPGKSRENKIKNDLIWELNYFLTTQFQLYDFYFCKNPPATIISKPISKFPKRCIAIEKLDDMFIYHTESCEDEIIKIKAMIDPLQKIEPDVFRELCCMENVDIEYVALHDLNQLLNIDLTNLSERMCRKMIKSVSSVYISLFGFAELTIIVNENELMKTILDIVSKYCISKVELKSCEL